mmetsp:Transcript_20872/g.36994  ORF Transcript_20872/g.36994 Transcript_20872/m.36994 type:complete len:101 (+) Transcript_20872:380-682(+)
MDQANQASALDSVTDHHEEKAAEVSESLVAQAMKEMAAAELEEVKAEAARKKELSAAQVEPEDVETIMKEFDLPKSAADLVLRESGGDLEATLLKLVKGA